MLIVVSPAKRLNEKAAMLPDATLPAFQDAANELADYARDLTPDDVQKLMKISDRLARLNADRFAAFEPVSTP